jgi:hypothetical protein
MGFTIEQGKDEVQAAHRFQVSAELQDIQLLDCAASVSDADAAPEGQLSLGLKMATEVLNVSGDDARFSVRIAIVGDPTGVAVERESHRFQVSCRYALEYKLRPGYAPSPEEIDAFKSGNAIFHCWPYSRELIHNLTAKMGLPVPPLPFLRLAPKTEHKPPRKRTAKPAVHEKAGSDS